jgi:uncharacterized membrane protein YgdD (TMEM256/DUF423 family)
MHQRFPLLAAGVLGATGVALGALGTHFLAAFLDAHGMREVWETAVRYQLFHALALLGLAGWLRPLPTGIAAQRAVRAARCWTAGTVLFSGSLYGLACGGPHWLGPVTPLGGVALIAGWAYAAGAAVAPRSEYDI